MRWPRGRPEPRPAPSRRGKMRPDLPVIYSERDRGLSGAVAVWVPPALSGPRHIFWRDDDFVRQRGDECAAPVLKR